MLANSVQFICENLFKLATSWNQFKVLAWDFLLKCFSENMQLRSKC